MTKHVRAVQFYLFIKFRLSLYSIAMKPKVCISLTIIQTSDFQINFKSKCVRNIMINTRVEVSANS